VLDVRQLLAREKGAFLGHREALRRSSAPPSPEVSEPNTFLHGFLLPFSLLRATLADPSLRAPYLRLFVGRAAAVALIGGFLIAEGKLPKSVRREAEIAFGDDTHEAAASKKARDGRKNAQDDRKKGREERRGEHGEGRNGGDAEEARGVRIQLGGLNINLGDTQGEGTPTDARGGDTEHAGDEHAERTAGETADDPDAKGARTHPPPRRSVFERTRAFFGLAWAWILAIIGVLSGTELFVVAFTRRYDDWFSFHASRFAGVRPEEDAPQAPKLALDLRWAVRKVRRRIRGYIVFAAGFPVLLLLQLVPSVGDALFSIAAVLWGWYWLGVFTAAKSAHAWADGDKAPPPAVIRSLDATLAPHRWASPFRAYTRLWARVTRALNPAACTFERSPASYLGLALARVILALPGLYLLARPIVPVAAGRICAESDPERRFLAGVPREPTAPAQPEAGAPV
jgi:hypothetical protein